MQRNAIVTGASSGIGRAVAVRLVAAGHAVVVNARGADALDALVTELAPLAGRAVAVAGDASDQQVITRLVDTCREEFGGPPTIGVVNAGHGLPGTVLTSDDTLWGAAFEVNTVGALRQLRAFAAAMVTAAQQQPQPLSHAFDIVVIGSSVGRNVSPFNSVYGATKFAVHGAAEGLRREVGPHGVRVSLVEPGVVATNFQATAGYDRSWFESYAAEIGPVLVADDIARAVEFIVDQPPHVHVNDVMVRPTRQPYP